jgi:thiamine kinase-like enzyme
VSEVALVAESGIETDAIHRALKPLLASGASGRRNRIASIERRPSPYSTSFSLEEIDVEFVGGGRMELMFKDLNWYSMLASAQIIKPFFLYDPVREIETYRRILKPKLLGTPRCYGSVVNAERGHYWLFMERVGGLQLRHVGEWATWLEAARWLGRLHSELPGGQSFVRTAYRSNLLCYDRTLYRQWILRAEMLLHRAEAAYPSQARRDIRWLASRYHKVIASLMALPMTFIHGEFYASNVLASTWPGGELRLCPVDWELAAIGPGLVDLAALCAGSWTPEQKAELADAYRRAYSGPPLGSFRSLLANLDRCSLHQAVQWLGWSLEWTPPEDQAQNWLEIALSLARRLKL